MGKIKRNPLITKRSMRFGNNFAFLMSIKTNQILTFESELEFCVFLHFETDHRVESIEMHPKIADIIETENCIPEEIPGGYLDMKITYIDGETIYYEIKYSEDLDENNESDYALRSRKQIRLQEAFCREKGLNYRVITEQDIHPGTFYNENLLFIRDKLWNMKNELNVIELNANKVLWEIEASGPIKIRYLEQVFDRTVVWNSVVYLLYKRKITADIVSKALSNDTEVNVI